MDRNLFSSAHLRRLKRPVSGLSILLVGFAAGAPVQAQSPTERMRTFAASLSGLSLVGSIEGGALEPSGERVFTLDLRSGTDYMVAGFCDDRCTDLNLAILDPEGVEVSADQFPDSEPVATFFSETTGRFRLVVTMASCGAPACRFSVGVLSRSETGLLGVGRDMNQWVKSLRAELAAEGYRDVGQGGGGSLGQGQEAVTPLSLEGGLEYRITGVCDLDCQDLDLVLMDQDGRVLESDDLPDAFPLLVYVPDSAGDFTVSARMRECDIEPCSFLLVVFAREEANPEGFSAPEGPVVFDTVYTGALTEDDDRFPDGEYVDLHTVNATAGQILILDLQSEDFDTFLFLESPGGDTEENDDFGDDRGHSRIQAAIGATGTYTVRVSSYAPAETGSYRLRVTLIEG